MSGFIPVRRLSGQAFAVESVVIPSSDTVATFIGDPIALAGGTDSADYLPTAAPAAAGAGVYGVVVGFQPDLDNLNQKHRSASTKRIARIVVATGDTVFKCRPDASVALADMNLLFDHVAAAGSATTGRSGYTLDDGTGGTGSGQWRLVGVVRDTDNMNNDATNFTDPDGTDTNVWLEVIPYESYTRGVAVGV